MDYTSTIRKFFIAITLLVIGAISFLKIGTIDAHSVITTGTVLVPAVIVMGFLGQKIGEIIDNPKNQADADYKLAVLNALKKMDKSMSLQDLNEKLSKSVAEPDISESEVESEDDIDI